MYTQQLEYLDNSFKKIDDLESRLREYFPEGSDTEWAMIIHDKDMLPTGELKSPHVHVMMYNKNKFSYKILKEVFKEEKQQYFEWFNNKLAGFMYLTHMALADQHKYQYDKRDVVSNFDYEDYVMTRHHVSDDNLRSILQTIIDGELSKKDVMDDSKLSSLYVSHKQKFDNAFNLALEKQKQDYERNGIEKSVLFVYSEDKRSGTGKSYYARQKAREIAESRNELIYETSASNDPFQNYMGEEIVILDDLRPEDFKVTDMLRLLDNNYITSVESRYSNKTVVASFIIITSIYSPEEFFRRMSGSKDEPLDQFIRRLTYAAEVKPIVERSMLKEKEITVYKSQRLDKPEEVKVTSQNALGEFETITYKHYFKLSSVKKKN